jgi:hypothetical protein
VPPLPSRESPARQYQGAGPQASATGRRRLRRDASATSCPGRTEGAAVTAAAAVVGERAAVSEVPEDSRAAKKRIVSPGETDAVPTKSRPSNSTNGWLTIEPRDSPSGPDTVSLWEETSPRQPGRTYDACNHRMTG